MTVGIAFAASRVSAQQPAPAGPDSASPAATQPAGAARSEAQSEEDQANAFLHAPIVQKIGNLMHLDVVTTSRIFLGINFTIIFLCITIPLGKFMPGLIRKRSQTLQHSIKTAREVTEDAKIRLSAVEARLAGLDQEIQKIRAQVEQESLEDQARIKAAIEDESARIVAAAEQELGAAAAQARRGLRNFAADLAIQHAEKQLTLTPETDRALIAEFIGQVAGEGAPKSRGGNN